MSCDFKVLTFDVVGTLIDFETGVLEAVRGSPAERRPSSATTDLRGLQAGPRHTSGAIERGYAHVYLHLATELGLPTDDAAADTFQIAVCAGAFSDSVAALKRLRRRFQLVAMTNADRLAFSSTPTRSAIRSTTASPPTTPGLRSPTRSSSPSTSAANRRSATSRRRSCTWLRASTTTSALPSLATGPAGSSGARARRALAARRRCHADKARLPFRVPAGARRRRGRN